MIDRLLEFSRVRTRGSVLGATAATAFTAVMINDPLSYVSDARFELSWSPGRVLSQVSSVWQQSGGLGRITPAEHSPLVVFAYALIRATGLSPAVTEHVWHAALLAVAGIGVTVLLATFEPRWGLTHYLAATAYMMNPLTLGMFSNSVLFLSTLVIAPWLHTAVLRAGREMTSWRWPAVIALALAVSTPVELPGALLNVGLLLPTVVYVLVIERSLSLQSFIQFCARTALLTVGAVSFVVIRTFAGSRELLQRLSVTEPPGLVNVASSYSESLRGMGNWLAYFRFGSTQPRPQFAPYLESIIVITATFVVPFVAIASLYSSKWRPRFLFVILCSVSLMMVVGVYASPRTGWGSLLARLYDAVPSSQALRNSMKAGGPLVLSLSVLFAVAVVQTADRWRGWRRRAVVAGAFGVVGLASFPVWTFNLYPPGRQIRDVPSYWRAASAWLNDAGSAGDGRILVLPGGSFPTYRWGTVGGDILDAFLTVSYVRAGSFPQSTPMAESIVSELDRAVGLHELSPDAFADVLRRLGVRYVVLRNDTDWKPAQQPRPSEFDSIRSSAEFTLVATFGAPGQHTAQTVDDTEAARRERVLPPIEVFEVGDWQPIVRLVPLVQPLLVSGDGEGWVSLAEQGFVAGSRPMMFTAPLGVELLTQVLQPGSPLLITDTNVLRYSSATASATYSSSALQTGATGAGVSSLFPHAGAQTVSYIPGVARVTSSVASVGQPWARAENILDGDPRTIWQTGSVATATGQWLQIDFEHPHPARTITITVPDSATGSRLLVARVETPNGSERDVVMVGPKGSVELDGQPISSLRLKVARVEGSGPLAIADVIIDDLDLAEYRQVPSDVVDRAKSDTALAAALESAALGFVFRREVGVGPKPVERVLRRRFELPGRSVLEIKARISRTDLESSSSLTVGRCGDLSLVVDGMARPMGVVEIDDDGIHAIARSCDDLVLAGGWHSTSHSADLQVDWLTLLPPNVSRETLFEAYLPIRPQRDTGADVR